MTRLAPLPIRPSYGAENSRKSPEFPSFSSTSVSAASPPSRASSSANRPAKKSPASNKRAVSTPSPPRDSCRRFLTASSRRSHSDFMPLPVPHGTLLERSQSLLGLFAFIFLAFLIGRARG